MEFSWRLQRLDRLRGEKEVDCVDFPDAVEVGRRIAVKGQQGLRMVVANGFERCEFAKESRFLAGGEGDLVVMGNGVLKRDEVDLVGAERADEDLVVAALQFQIDDILKNSPLVARLVGEKQPAKARVGEVVLGVGAQNVPALDVVAAHAVKEVGLAERFGVGVQRGVGNGQAFVLEDSDDFVDRVEVADVVGEEFDQTAKRGDIPVAVACDDVLVDDGVENAREIVVLRLGIRIQQGGEGEAAKGHVVPHDVV